MIRFALTAGVGLATVAAEVTAFVTVLAQSETTLEKGMAWTALLGGGSAIAWLLWQRVTMIGDRELSAMAKRIEQLDAANAKLLAENIELLRRYNAKDD